MKGSLFPGQINADNCVGKGKREAQRFWQAMPSNSSTLSPTASHCHAFSENPVPSLFTYSYLSKGYLL